MSAFLDTPWPLIGALTDLRNTLKDLLLTLCKKPHAFSMDFDPHRETAADDAASKNLEQVSLLSRAAATGFNA